MWNINGLPYVAGSNRQRSEEETSAGPGSQSVSQSLSLSAGPPSPIVTGHGGLARGGASRHRPARRPAPGRLGQAASERRAGREMAGRLALRLGRSLVPSRGGSRSVLLLRALGSVNFSTKENVEPTKQPLKKPKLPVGRFDEAEESNKETEPLEKFPDDINPVTKEKGGPRGPEPTRYGDWERKGRCIDF